MGQLRGRHSIASVRNRKNVHFENPARGETGAKRNSGGLGAIHAVTHAKGGGRKEKGVNAF